MVEDLHAASTAKANSNPCRPEQFELRNAFGCGMSIMDQLASKDIIKIFWSQQYRDYNKYDDVQCIRGPQIVAATKASDVRVPYFDPQTISDQQLDDVLLILKQRRIKAYEGAVNELPEELVKDYKQLEEAMNKCWGRMITRTMDKPQPTLHPNHPTFHPPPEISNADDQRVTPTTPTFPRRRHKFYLARESTAISGTRLTSDEQFSGDDCKGELKYFCNSDWAMGTPNTGVLPIRPAARDTMTNKQLELVCFTDMHVHCLRGDLRNPNHLTRRGFFMLLLTKLSRRVPLGHGKFLYYIKTEVELDIAALILWCSKKNHIACHIQPFNNDDAERGKAVIHVKQQQPVKAIPQRIHKFVSPNLLCSNGSTTNILRLLCLGIREGVVLAIEAEALTHGLSHPLADIIYGKLFIKTWWDITAAQQMWETFFKGHCIDQPFPLHNSHCISRMISLRCIRQPKDIINVVTSLYPCPDIVIEIKPASLNAPIGQFRDNAGKIVTSAERLITVGKSIIAHVSAHWSILICLALKHVNRPINPFDASQIDDLEILSFQLLDGQPILQTISNSETLSQAVLEQMLTETAIRHSATPQHNTEQIRAVFSTTATGQLCNETGSREPPLTLNIAPALIHDEIRRTAEQMENRPRGGHSMCSDGNGRQQRVATTSL